MFTSFQYCDSDGCQMDPKLPFSCNIVTGNVRNRKVTNELQQLYKSHLTSCTVAYARLFKSFKFSMATQNFRRGNLPYNCHIHNSIASFDKHIYMYTQWKQKDSLAKFHGTLLDTVPSLTCQTIYHSMLQQNCSHIPSIQLY